MSPHETFCTLYPFFVACGFCGCITKNAKNVFVLWGGGGGGAFPMTVSKSSFSSESALLCTSESSLFFDFCFVFFFSVHFCTNLRFVRSEQKEDIQNIR